MEFPEVGLVLLGCSPPLLVLLQLLTQRFCLRLLAQHVAAQGSQSIQQLHWHVLEMSRRIHPTLRSAPLDPKPLAPTQV